MTEAQYNMIPEDEVIQLIESVDNCGMGECNWCEFFNECEYTKNNEEEKK